MSPVIITLLVLLGVGLLLALWLMGIYNGLVVAGTASRTPSPRSTCSSNAATS